QVWLGRASMCGWGRGAERSDDTSPQCAQAAPINHTLGGAITLARDGSTPGTHIGAYASPSATQEKPTPRGNPHRDLPARHWRTAERLMEVAQAQYESSDPCSFTSLLYRPRISSVGAHWPTNSDMCRWPIAWK